MNNKDILDNAPDGATHWDFNEYMRWHSEGEWECYNENTREWEHACAESTIQSLVDIKRIVERVNALENLLGTIDSIDVYNPYLATAERKALKVLEE